MRRVDAIDEEQSWQTMVAAFDDSNLSTLPELGRKADERINELVGRMMSWHQAVVEGLADFPDRSVASKLSLAGQLIAEGLHLRADLDTSEVQSWMQHPDTAAADSAAFDSRRRRFIELLEAMAECGSDVFRRAEFSLPSQVGQRAWYHNAKKLAQILGGRRIGPIEAGLPGVMFGLGRIARQERTLVLAGLGRQVRSTPLLGWTNRQRVDVVNRRLRSKNKGNGVGYRLDYSRAEHLRAAHRVLKAAGVRYRQANQLIDQALELGQASSGKPWRGLIQLRELLVHAEQDPSTPEFMAELEQSLVGPIHYSHTPGREWSVRDFTLARALLKVDGKTCRTTESVAVTQAGASIVPGVLANNPAMLGLAAHYMKPIQVYMNGMVAKSGPEHRRHKNVFQDYFRKGEVLDEVEFIEATVESILDEVERKASRRRGRFDFKQDLAFNFPIRIICHFMGIPVEDAAKVQYWAEASVRALDASAGLSLGLLTEGNRSAGDFLDYLSAKVERARNGEQVPGIIGNVAATTELNDVELVSNLAGITFAGFETTTGLLSLGFAELLKHPEQYSYLQHLLVSGPEVVVDIDGKTEAVSDQELRWYVWAHDERKGRVGENREDRYRRLTHLLANSNALAERLEAIRVQEHALGQAVEEMLRWTAPGSVIPLTMEEDFELESPIDATVQGCPVTAGQPITFTKGQTITVDVAGANRSGCPFGAGQFEQNSGDFDISRTDNTSHLSFGVTHICMGADLAVENAKRMIEQIARRMPDLELDGLPDELDGNLFIGLESLPVQSRALIGQAAR